MATKKKEKEPEELVTNETKLDLETIYGTKEEVEKSEEKLDEALKNAKSEDEAKKVIEGDINKVEKLKKNAEKIIKKYSNMQISNSWNGMIEDW